MEAKQIRCISIKPDKKTGEYQVRYLSEKVVNNPFFMRKYGWRVEEVEAEKQNTAKKEHPTPETQDLNIADPEEFDEAPEPEFIETPEMEEVKAPVKPKATRAKRKTTKK